MKTHTCAPKCKVQYWRCNSFRKKKKGVNARSLIFAALLAYLIHTSIFKYTAGPEWPHESHGALTERQYHLFFWFPALLLPTQSNHTLHIIIIAANRLLTMQRISGLNSSMSHIACYFFFHSLSLKTKSLRLPHIPSLFCHHILLVSCPSVFARSSLWVARPGSCLC